VTYGLDVMAYIAQRRNGEQKQFKEIWQELQTDFNLEISEREVGRLYRKIQALLMGSQADVQQELAEAATKYGRLIMAVDGLQPDGSGPKLYILHEVLSNTLVSVAMFDQANTSNLTEWLVPYREWRDVVQASLSDNEKALVAALKATWPEAPHQLCQMHFIKDLSEPVHEADRKLQQTMREAMGQLPPVPVPQQEPESEEEEVRHQGHDATADEETDTASRPSVALMQWLDIISGVELETLDTFSLEKGLSPLSEPARMPESYPEIESPVSARAEPMLPFPLTPTGPHPGETSTADYLSASETVAWINHILLAQVPASARPLVEARPEPEAITYWEQQFPLLALSRPA
jgi:hypothetical protein